MRHWKWLSLACVPLAFVAATAQQPRTFKTRLAPVPIDVSMQATIAVPRSRRVIVDRAAGGKVSLKV